MINMKKLLTSGLLFLFLAGPAGAQAVKESLKDVPYDEVLKMATENNDPKAQYDLGVRYFQGEGVEKDPLKARQWYEKAAAQGHSGAESNLGYMYENGITVDQDYAKAKEFYEKGAAKNDEYALYNLASLYKEGRGVAKDPLKAKELFEKSAELGLVNAQYYLSLIHI